MEAVSAVKMRKSQGVALTARPYATAALKLLKSISASPRTDLGSEERSVLGEKREVKNTLLVVVTSDKGLAGSFNANVLKRAEVFIRSRSVEVNFYKMVEVNFYNFRCDGGEESGGLFYKARRTPIVALTGYGDYAEISEVQPIFDAVVEAFTQKSR